METKTNNHEKGTLKINESQKEFVTMLSPKAEEMLKDIVNRCRSKSKEINESVVGQESELEVVGQEFELEKDGDEEIKSCLNELEKEQHVDITRVYGQDKDNWTAKLKKMVIKIQS